MRTKTLALFAMAALAASTAVAADLPAQAKGATAVDTLQRAELLAARQSWDGAIAAYREAIAASPKDAALWNRLGICYQRKGDAKAARAAYKKALDPARTTPRPGTTSERSTTPAASTSRPSRPTARPSS